MVGIPKSKACQTCKIRRTKCDQQWPTCSPCKRKGYNCPGPSSLVKFVYEDPGPSQSKGQSKFDHQSGDEGMFSKPQPLSNNTAFLISRNGTTRFWAAKFASPKPQLTSPADHVAARLANTLEKDSFLKSCYIQQMPSRLNHNSCLRDIANFFCSAVMDHRQGVQSGVTVATMQHYGKALRSLRGSLDGKEAPDLETLASIALLNRAEAFFNPSWRPLEHVHAEMIISVAKKIGKPKAGDTFHYGILFETIEDLSFYFYTKYQEGIVYQYPWVEWFEKGGMNFSPPEIRPYAMDLSKMSSDFYASGPKLLAKVQKINNDPYSTGVGDLAVNVLSILSERFGQGLYRLNRLIDKAFELGEMTKAYCEDFLTDTIYQFKNGSCATLLYTTLGLLAGMARMLYDLSTAHDLPSAQKYWETYRQTSVHLWMFLPYLLEITDVVASRSLIVVAVSYEAADELEKDYLRDMLIKEDKHRKRLPTDKEGLTGCIMMQARAMTGRLLPD